MFGVSRKSHTVRNVRNFLKWRPLYLVIIWEKGENIFDTSFFVLLPQFFSETHYLLGYKHTTKYNPAQVFSGSLLRCHLWSGVKISVGSEGFLCFSFSSHLCTDWFFIPLNKWFQSELRAPKRLSHMQVWCCTESWLCVVSGTICNTFNLSSVSHQSLVRKLSWQRDNEKTVGEVWLCEASTLIRYWYIYMF